MNSIINHSHSIYGGLSIERLSITQAMPDQVSEITNMINDAFWPSHKIFLDENNPASKLRVDEKFIKNAIAADDTEFYVLTDTVNSFIIGSILLQKTVENEPNAAKFNLLVRNPKFICPNTLKIGDILMTHIIRRAQQIGKILLKIDVVDTGEDSNKLMKFYEERGFTKTGKTFNFPRKHLLKPSYKDKVCLVEFKCVIAKPCL